MLKWPSRATNAIRLLYEPLQEIDVYVEDLNDEAFYRTLLNAVTGGKIKIARVFALGGKCAVVDAARAHDHKARRALFIVDGDLSWVQGRVAPTVKGLHLHEAYCIENLLLCELALSTIYSQEAVLPFDEARAKLTYAEWRKSVSNLLGGLFAAYATLNEFDATIPTVSCGVGNLCHPSAKRVPQKLDDAKVKAAELNALAEAEKKASSERVAARFNEIMARVQSLPEPLHAISGKDFLLPLIDFHLQGLGCRIRRGSLRMRLATAGDMERFGALANSLKAAAQGVFAK